ncbi:MAG: hypothetical protein FRX49_04404 [Trebouxia sp. A1-2]|nr:MAG: hypothetical protein FRX49_04404 [Trebouxia sp. A1-2]
MASNREGEGGEGGSVLAKTRQVAQHELGIHTLPLLIINITAKETNAREADPYRVELQEEDHIFRICQRQLETHCMLLSQQVVQDLADGVGNDCEGPHQDLHKPGRAGSHR